MTISQPMTFDALTDHFAMASRDPNYAAATPTTPGYKPVTDAAPRIKLQDHETMPILNIWILAITGRD